MVFYLEVGESFRPRILSERLTFRRLEVFYTSLYRALLFPRRLDEETPAGGWRQPGGRKYGDSRARIICLDPGFRFPILVVGVMVEGKNWEP